MTHQEKRAWIMLVVSSAAYAAYAAVILSRAGGHPLARAPYAAAMLMAMAGWDRFWIANGIYLCGFLSALLGSVTKVIAYRKTVPQW